MSELFATYVIGEPGAGKSTLVDHLTRAVHHEEAESPFPHRVYEIRPREFVWELGRRRAGGFSGTDALSMSVQPMVENFIEGIRPRMLLAEGDRLANDKFFHFLVGLGYQLAVYEVRGPERADLHRRIRGSKQDAHWLKGRQTKVRRLTDRWAPAILPAGAPLADLELLMTDPVSEALKAGRLVRA